MKDKENKNMIKEEINQLKQKKKLMQAKFIIGATAAVTGTNLYAGGLDDQAGTDIWNAFLGFMATWMGRIGIGVLIFGAFQTAFGFKNDDADAKTKGLKTAASGIMVFALSKSIDFFTGIS